MKTIRVIECSGSAALRELLERHPGVELGPWKPSDRLAIRFLEADMEREVLQGRVTADGTYGLIELMDNNPLVCAERASIPGALATLGLICLGPLARAEMLAGRPSVAPSFEDDGAELAAALQLEGFSQGVDVSPRAAEGSGLLSARCVAPLRSRSPAEVEELFSELYGRSFFLRPAKVLADDQIAGSPFATYAFDSRRLEAEGVLEVRAVADADGKCGAAQMIHMLNVMAGFEEDLGLSRPANMEQTR
jgi:N-acetyl-gamma-glutamylphosphate reductase